MIALVSTLVGRGRRQALRARLLRRPWFALATLAQLSLFWIVPHPPMLDLPEHAGQVALLHDLVSGSSPWRDLVQVDLFTPYLLGYGSALLLSFVVPVTAALKLTLSLAYLAFVAACVGLRRQLGGDERLDYLFIPGFFGFAFDLGFFTFLVAAPVGVLFIHMALACSAHPSPGRARLLGVMQFVLFCSHGLVFVFANLVGAGVTLVSPGGLRAWRRCAPAYAVAPVLAVTHYAMTRQQSLGLYSPAVAWHWSAGERLAFLYGPMTSGPLDTPMIALAAATLLTPVLLGARLQAQRAPYVPFAITVGVWLIGPVNAMNVWAVYERFAIFLLPFYALLFRALTAGESAAVRQRLRMTRVLLPALIYLFVACKLEHELAFAAATADFEDLLTATQPGKRALSLVLDPISRTGLRLNGFGDLMHFPVWYQAERHGFVEPNFALAAAPLVHFRAGRASRVDLSLESHPESFDWVRDDARIYDYFFVRALYPLPVDFFANPDCAVHLRKRSSTWLLFERGACSAANRR